MSNELTIFNNSEFGEIRTLLMNDEPWFVAVDVCKALDIDDTSKAVARLDEDEGTRIEIPHPQNKDKTLIVNAINEAGTIYSSVR